MAAPHPPAPRRRALRWRDPPDSLSKHERAKAREYEFHLFQPEDGYFEYSMVAATKVCSERTLWAFMAGRGGPTISARPKIVPFRPNNGFS